MDDSKVNLHVDWLVFLLCLIPDLFSQVSRDSPSEVNRLRRERDELQSLVEKFEKHLTEVRNSVHYSHVVGVTSVVLANLR